MVKRSPFKGLKDKKLELEVGDETVLVAPARGDAEIFLLMGKDMSKEDASKISEMLLNILVRANPEEKKEDIEQFIVIHYGELVLQLGYLFGFTTKKELEELKKKRMEIFTGARE